MPNLTRRDLLNSGAALAATALLPAFARAAQAGASGKASPLKLGQCSYTFRKFMPQQMMDMLRQAKITNLNIKADFHLPMTPLSSVPAEAQTYRDAGFQLTNTGAIYFKVDTDEAVKPSFEYLKAAKITQFVGAPTHETLPRIARFCQQYDVRMGIHNHGPEDHEWPSPYDIQKVIEPMDHRIGYCIDLGHTLRTKTDPVAAIRMAGKRLYDVHIKDLSDPLVKESQVALGDGVMPVRKVFEALIEIGYSGYVDLEYEVMENDPLPGVIKSQEYMKKVLREMGYNVA